MTLEQERKLREEIEKLAREHSQSLIETDYAMGADFVFSILLDRVKPLIKILQNAMDAGCYTKHSKMYSCVNGSCPSCWAKSALEKFYGE